MCDVEARKLVPSCVARGKTGFKKYKMVYKSILESRAIKKTGYNKENNGKRDFLRLKLQLIIIIVNNSNAISSL